MNTPSSSFNVHQNKTSNGVIITEGLVVRDYNRRIGKVVADPTFASEIMCCGKRDHLRDNDLVEGKSCTDHYCNHDHWFEVEYEDKDGRFDQPVYRDQFNGSRLYAVRLYGA